MKACENCKYVRKMANGSLFCYGVKEPFEIKSPVACKDFKSKDNIEMVDHPSHYGGKGNPFEPIRIIDYYNLNFDLGNVIKYTLRAGKKDDNPILQDLEKAKFYLNHEIERIRKRTESCDDVNPYQE